MPLAGLKSLYVKGFITCHAALSMSPTQKYISVHSRHKDITGKKICKMLRRPHVGEELKLILNTKTALYVSLLNQ